MNEDFHDFLAALIAAGARFVVVGAHALAVHGVPRATGDLDVWIGPGGIEIPFLGRAELIRNKQASGRPKDTADLDALRSSR